MKYAAFLTIEKETVDIGEFEDLYEAINKASKMANEIKEHFNNQPAIFIKEVEPKWNLLSIIKTEIGTEFKFRCSECGNIIYGLPTNFCSNCGVNMVKNGVSKL